MEGGYFIVWPDISANYLFTSKFVNFDVTLIHSGLRAEVSICHGF